MNMTKLFYFFFSSVILNSNAHFTSSQPTTVPNDAISISKGKKSKAPTSEVTIVFPVSDAPSKAPSVPPTKRPTTKRPSKAPSKAPITLAPSVPPTKIPVTMMPSVPPTKRPTTKRPSKAPSKAPITLAPSIPPTKAPLSKAPSIKPTYQPFKKVTPEMPLASSTTYPTAYLSKSPTKQPQFSIIYVSPVSSDNSNPNVPHKPKPRASPTKV